MNTAYILFLCIWGSKGNDMLGVSLRMVDGGTWILEFQSRNIAFKGFARTKLIIDTVDHAIVFFFKRELIDTCIVVKLQHTNCVLSQSISYSVVPTILTLWVLQCLFSWNWYSRWLFAEDSKIIMSHAFAGTRCTEFNTDTL